MSSSSIVEADIEEEEDAVDTFRDSNPDDVVDTESRLLFKKFSFKLHSAHGGHVTYLLQQL